MTPEEIYHWASRIGYLKTTRLDFMLVIKTDCGFFYHRFLRALQASTSSPWYGVCIVLKQSYKVKCSPSKSLRERLVCRSHFYETHKMSPIAHFQSTLYESGWWPNFTKIHRFTMNYDTDYDFKNNFHYCTTQLVENPGSLYRITLIYFSNGPGL